MYNLRDIASPSWLMRDRSLYVTTFLFHWASVAHLHVGNDAKTGPFPQYIKKLVSIRVVEVENPKFVNNIRAPYANKLL